jgi:predicted DNA-binding transcriptional regulator AlpA
MTDQSKLSYSIAELVTATGINRSTIYEHLRAGYLRSRKVGGRRVVLAEDALAWLRSEPPQPGGENRAA